MIILLTHDHSVFSRVNKDLMSQQTLMELLVKDVDDQRCFQNVDKSSKDIDEWPDIERAENGDVISIHWVFDHYRDDFNALPLTPGGTIDLQWIPLSVKKFSIIGLMLHGVVDTRSLPAGLNTFDIDENELTGNFDLEGLPRALDRVSLQYNSFSGSLNLPKLPKTLRDFDGPMNKFSGSLDLTSLPPKIHNLHLYGNRFSGEINLEYLPYSISSLLLHDNQLHQTEIKLRSGLTNLSLLEIDKKSFEEFVVCDGEKYQDWQETMGVISVCMC